MTGAQGFLGRYVVAYLRARGDVVVETDLPDDLSAEGVADVVVAHAMPRAVVHLAARLPPASYHDPGRTRAVNVEATTALLAACRRHVPDVRFVQASSYSVGGSRNPHRGLGLLTADTPPAPMDTYGRTKLEAEARVRASGLDWTILRLGVVTPVRARWPGLPRYG